MNASSAQFRLLVIAAAAVVLLVANQLIVQPFLNYRDDLLARCQSDSAALRDQRQLLAETAHLQSVLQQTPVSTDASAAEGQLLHLVSRWEQHAALTNTSFSRLRTAEMHGYRQITVAVAATGSMRAVACLLHSVESARVPLRIESLRVSSAREQDGSELRVELVVSTLCKPTAAVGAMEGVAAAFPTGRWP